MMKHIINCDEQIWINGYRPNASSIESLKMVKQWIENKLYANVGKSIDAGCLVVFQSDVQDRRTNMLSFE